MPSLTFVLPHWLYWLGLLAFPLAAIFIIARRRRSSGTAPRVSLPLAYLLWISGGFVGLHRLYLFSFLGFFYVPFFVAILLFNVQEREARNLLSSARNEILSAEFLVERAEKKLEDEAEGAADKLTTAKADLVKAATGFQAATVAFDEWHSLAGWAALAIAAFLLLDAALLPGLVRRRNIVEAESEPESQAADDLFEAGAKSRPAQDVRTPITEIIDRISGWSGEFVAYWSLIAVFVYYYEVIARYVFNSPTNWAHESMFLMFGMQYLIAGAYALREDAHVRVDVIYTHLSPRAKVITDLITSIFFFVFTLALLGTGWIFMMDSIDVWEVSFTEWAIQYWPVKMAVTIGAFLIVLQGISLLIKNIVWLTRGAATGGAAGDTHGA